ncbi:MAG: histidine kinase [Cyanobacteria bacterium J06641_5]
MPSPAALKLWLFVDKRPSSQEHVRSILAYLETLQQECSFELETVEVEKQPQLAEHFRLIATPALVKISPEPRHTLAGTDLVAQLQNCWPQWCEGARKQQALGAQQLPSSEAPTSSQSAVDSAEQLRLADEIFRLQREKEELEEQLRFKDRVLAMWAHDLRNPLTAASIALETLVLARKKTPPLELVNLYQRIIEQAQNQFQIMNRMIADILETAKGNQVELQVQPQRLLLQDLAAEVLEQFAPACAAKSLTVTQDLPQDLPAAYGDRELVRQVFVNLLDNAVKYTPPGGQISLAILHRTMQKLQVSIADSGPGIPSEQKQKIFQGHVRLARDTGKDGYGLGLSLCLQVVRAHYGQIWVDSVPERGSCFHFTLPVFPKG